MMGSTYSPDTWESLQASKVGYASVGMTATCSAGTDTNIDFVLTDDVFIRFIELIAVNALFGDKITMKIIDTNGITGVPAGTTLATVVSNYNVTVDQNKFYTYVSAIPKKALATMTIRIVYTSTSESTAVNFAVNYILLKPLL